jgi:23S rRNA (uracil1939-C5)-methyltransferase
MRTDNLTIERLGINGEGVGYIDGYTVFVDGALPGEHVAVEFYERRKSFGRARILHILKASPDRVTPPCPLFGQCGGCQLMHLSYAKQLEAKRQRVQDALERIGKFQDVTVLPCIASPNPLAYRNKIQLPVSPGSEGIRLGLYAMNSHDLVEVEQCLIHCELGEKAFQQIKKILKAAAIPAYNPETGQGILRHVLIKTAVHTNQVLVILVATEEVPKLLAAQILNTMPEIKGVVLNLNTAKSNTILGSELTLRKQAKFD